MIYIDLIYNLSLLVALSVISGFIENRWNRNTRLGVLMQGALFGGVAILGMLRPLNLAAGLLFDGRSIMLSICALFFGPLAATLAGLMTITCRMALGGAGALTGILVILSSIGIGLLAHYYLKAYENLLTISNLYIFGLVVHLVMIALMFSMPEGVRLYAVIQIGIPVMLLYPLATILVGKILSDQFDVKAIMARLQESEEKLNAAQRMAKLGNFVWDLETGEVIWSDSLYDLSGYDKSERIDREKIKTKLYHPDDVERINQWLKDCISSGNGVLTPNEYRVIRKDGEIIDVYTTGIIEHREGKPQKVFATIQDISDMKRYEKKLHDTLLRQNMAVKAANVGLWDWDLVTNKVHYSSEWKRQIGYEDHEISDDLEEWRKRVHPDDLESTLEQVQRSIAEIRQGHMTEFRFRHKDGSYRWILAQGSIIQDESGRAVRMIGSHVDITEYKLAKEAIKEHEKKFEAVFENTSVGILLADIETKKFSLGNKMICEMFGYNMEEINSMGVEDIHPRENLPYVLKEYELHTRGEKILAESIPCLRKDGSIFYADVQTTSAVISGKKYNIGFFRDITKQKQAEEAVRESERKYRGLFENSTDFVFTLDLKGNFTDFNKAAEELTGYTKNELIGMNYKDYTPDDTHENISKAFKRIYNEDKPLKDFPLEVRIKNGSTRFFETCVSPLRKGEEIIGLQGSSRDISDRIRMEEELKEREQYFRSVLYNMHEDILVIDSEYRITDVNNTFLIKSGYGREEVIGLPCHEILHGLDAPCSEHGHECKIMTVFETGEPCNLIHGHINKNGEKIWIDIILSPLKDRNGNVTHVIEASHDITKLKKTERLLKESEERYRNILEGSPVGISVHCEGKLVFTNIAGANLLGADSPEEIVGKPIAEIIHPDNLNMARERIQRLLAGEKGLYPVEDRYVRLDGRTIDVEVMATPLEYEGKPAIQVVINDITEKKLIEEELKKSVSQYRTLIENLPQKIFLKDRRSVYLLCNENYARDLKIKPEEIFGKTDNDFYSRELAEKYRFDDQRLMETNKIEDFEEQYVLHGEGKWIHTVKVPVKDGQGDVIGVLGIFWDITEEKRLKEQFLQAQKMEAIGVLAGGVAHDFNNILTTIIGNAQLAQINMEKDDFLYEPIEEIKKAGERGSHLTSQLLAFSRKQIIQPTMLNLNDIITDMEKMIGRLIGEDVKLLMILEPKLFPVKMDKGQIEQVIMNLVVNAKDAMPEGGKLIIETANMVLSGDYFSKHSIKGDSGNYVMLSVSDNGIGMDKEIQKHIFEPFYSTKEKGKGTGLGLSTVYGIIKQNNGFIWVYSEPGQGSVFKVYFPRIKADADSEKIEQQPEGVIGGSETVLLVEDDDGLRKLLRGILNKKGYKVLEAENGEDALRISGTHDGPIDLILTDVVMPKMSGKKVVERLQRLYPHVKVIYMSGYTDDAIVHHGVLEPGINFIEKPFTTEKLARKIREVLDDK